MDYYYYIIPIIITIYSSSVLCQALPVQSLTQKL